MENILETLANKEKDNYEKYLKIMSESISHSSKGLIPFFAANRKNILDVGSGSGILVEEIRKIDKNAKITGIDLNEFAIDTCNKKNIENTTFLKLSLKELKEEIINNNKEKFDCIIFSSVLHEFSSYATKDVRYSEIPILEAIATAKEILEENGIIIIRDGLKETKQNLIELNFKEKKDEKFLEKYQTKYHKQIKIEKINDKFYLNAADLKEFLYTYTWGEKSFEREVKEQFGILSKREWRKILQKNNLKITAFNTYKEEYIKYLEEKIIINNDIKNLFNESVIFIVARKE